METHIPETGPLKYGLHLRPVRKSLHCGRQIVVGAFVVRYCFAYHGKQDVRVNAEQLFHRETLRGGELYYYKAPARFCNPQHFFQPAVEAFKIPYAVCHSYGVECVVGKRQVHAVAFVE